MTERLDILSSSLPSRWASCRIITPSLETAYRRAFPKSARFHSLTESMNSVELITLARELRARASKRIVFLDHVPHPGPMLRALCEVYEGAQMPELCIHVYGDFTLFATAWLACEELLRLTPVRFICASHRERALLARLMRRRRGSTSMLDVCPFPVDLAQYSFDPKLRKKARKSFGARDGELLVVYAGRMSQQKNTLRMARELSAFGRASRVPWRLLLAGEFDDIGAPFFKRPGLPGSYFGEWRDGLAELPREDRARIQELGLLGPSELKALYHAADAYLSLSLHHDEDFGMAPAEALCCGTPVILTNWGGYASFADPAPATPDATVPTKKGDRKSKPAPASCRLVGVQIGSQGLSISTRDLAKALFQVSASRETSSARALRARLQADRFSIQAAIGILKRIHDEPFAHFGSFTPQMTRLTEWSPQGVLFPDGPRLETGYEEIYGAYVEN